MCMQAKNVTIPFSLTYQDLNYLPLRLYLVPVVGLDCVAPTFAITTSSSLTRTARVLTHNGH
jgi:hypothetical protein